MTTYTNIRTHSAVACGALCVTCKCSAVPHLLHGLCLRVLYTPEYPTQRLQLPQTQGPASLTRHTRLMLRLRPTTPGHTRLPTTTLGYWHQRSRDYMLAPLCACLGLDNGLCTMVCECVIPWLSLRSTCMGLFAWPFAALLGHAVSGGVCGLFLCVACEQPCNPGEKGAGGWRRGGCRRRCGECALCAQRGDERVVYWRVCTAGGVHGYDARVHLLTLHAHTHTRQTGWI